MRAEEEASAARDSRVHVVLFKPTDLRVHDHEPLRAAHHSAKAEGSAVLHLLVLDSFFFGPGAPLSREAGLPRLTIKRASFLLESVVALHRTLAERGYSLLVYRGSTASALDVVASACTLVCVHSHGPDFTSEERRIQRSVSAQLKLYWGWTLTHQADLPSSMRGGHATPERYKPFLDAVSRGKGPARFRPALPEPPWEADEVPIDLLAAIEARGAWGLPTLQALLSSRTAAVLSGAAGFILPGGEAAALAALHEYVWEERLYRYVGSSDSMTPGVDNALNSTTRLSAYLAHGCLSARRLYEEVRAYERRRLRNRSTYWVYHELVMRDFLAFSCLKWGSRLFSADGPLDASGHAWRDARDSETRRLFDRWTRGLTGYPFVDAGMRQLAAEGQMPHLLRQMCAAFLVRDLRVPWRWGAEWFESQLVDYTPDANWGNWAYRILPVAQLQPLCTEHLTSLEILSWPVVHDPHLEYILQWVPELRSVAEQHGPTVAREPWRLAKGCTRRGTIDVRPRRDSPLWVMSVNRQNWPEYQQMLGGKGHLLSYTPASDSFIDPERCRYTPPLVPPVELEIRLERIPVDHSWGAPTARTPAAPRTLAAPLVRRHRSTKPRDTEQEAAELPAVPATLPTAAALTLPPPSSLAGGTHQIWFRKGLRVHDNPALLSARDAAVSTGTPLLAVFVIDPCFVRRAGPRRLQFLCDALQDLAAALQRLGVRLLVPRGSPLEVIPALWRRCHVRRCTWEKETEPHALARDASIVELAAEQQVEVVQSSGHTLYDIERLREGCGGPSRTLPTKYSDFLRLIEAAGPPAAPRPTPVRLPKILSAGGSGLNEEEEAAMAVPETLGAMGYTDAPPGDADESSRLRGGESAALARLDAAVCARAGWVCAFSKPDTNPLQYSPGSTTMLSPYLSLGCLSCRTMHAALDAIVRQAEGQHTTPPQSLHGQLYFREFFHLLSASSPHFGRTRDNPLCLAVEWRDPARDADAAEALRRWEGGTTGVPLIDAAMVQLKEVGWLHHLLRHVVACFLTRGQLWIDWEAGRNVFDRHLLDADWAINSANWMWLSATSFFYTYHRVYSTAHFARKYDRSGRYVRKWLPALRRMPDEYVYEPWKAPLAVQRAASCVVGVDYPLPICDPESAAAANLTRMDACYRKAPEEWKALIPPAAAAEVARERNVNVRSRVRAAAFRPTALPPSPNTAPLAHAPAGSSAVDSEEGHRGAPPAPPLGRALGRSRGRSSSRGRGSRGRVSRVQHGVY